MVVDKRTLIAELNQALNGYANGGPLSTPLATPSETAIRNVQTAPNRVVALDQQDQYNQYSDDDSEFDCDCEDEFDCDCGDEFDCDDDEFSPEEDRMFSRFKDWLLQNSSLMSHEDEESGGNDDIENLDPEIDDLENNDLENNDPDDDPNDDGIKRSVKGAHLVYKRKQPDGYFEELWFYNIGKESTREEMEVKRDILAATDIPPNATHSEDGTQEYTLWTVGNGQMLCIKGVPN